MKSGRTVRSLVLAGLLLISLPFAGKAQPTFNHGSVVSVTICQGSGPVDITSYLAVTDPAGPGVNTDTWDISQNPSSGAPGTLTGFPTFQLSTGGTITPTGLWYQPDPTFTGNDPFIIMVYDQNHDTSRLTVNVIVTPLPSFHIDAVPAVCAGATGTNLYYSALSQLGPTTATFATPGVTSWQVPPGVSCINFDVQGGAGGNDSHSPAGTTNPGNGARVQGALCGLSTGEILNLYIGGSGGNGTVSGATGGFNGGGNASFYFFGCGGAGGGASDIRVGGTLLSNRVVVAGGGGGNGWDAPGPSCGGYGGHDGSTGCSNVGGGHAGGGSTTLSSGGAGAAYAGWASGQNGALGLGGNGSTQGISGGGGGGYYGGGGGVWSGGGGGSSFTDPSSVTSATVTPNYNISSGAIAVNYVIPGNYDINWDATAISAGFVDVSTATLPSSPISISLPTTAPAGTYTGSIRIRNTYSLCTSVDYPFSVTINPIPDVAPMTNQSYCNGDPTTVAIFTGSVPGTTFNWTCDNTTIGLAASGSGNIGSFTATNSGSAPVTALITVTPTANGCTGAPISFTITVNPTPLLLTTVPIPGAICDSTVFSFTPGSATTGASYTWFRGPMSGISVGGSFSGASGAGDPMETLVNSTSDPVVVPYTYVLAANGCTNSQNVNITVNPNPALSSSLFPGYVCNGQPFSYAPTSTTAGVSFTWNRNWVTGISNSPHTGTGNPGESLINTTTDPIPVPYTYTLTLMGSSCFSTQVVTVTVNPTPMLNTTLTPAAVCNNTLFSYGPGSNTANTTFTWSRGPVTGISNPPVPAGIDSINETLVNTTAFPVVVPYMYMTSIMGTTCADTQTVNVTVYPTPRLSSDLHPVICDSTALNYNPTSVTPGTTYTWTRAAVAGIRNLARAGFGNIVDTLVNITPNPITVTYVLNLSANGCPPNVQNVNLTVNPRPTFTSSLTPPAICDSAKFNYTPVSGTAGVLFTWERPYIPGIYAIQQTGTGDPNQYLINSTYVVVNVTYVYTLTANGCNNVQNVVVPVNPTPKLNPPYTGTVCSGSPFVYTPTSYTPGAIFAWDRPAVPHVGPSSSFTGNGTGTINETLVTDVTTPVNTYYYFRLGINGCVNLYTQTVKLTINPTPGQPNITVFPPSTLCSGAMYQNFGGDPVQEGIQYTWTASNAYVFAEGTDHQYALVSFENPGTAVVSLTTNINNFGCSINSSYTVNVTGSAATHPGVTYYNGQFICLENDVDTYQWGYDDARTLDSTIISGQIDQNYNNSNPDFSNKNYWVMTTKGGCLQKSYYNRPSGIVNVNNEAADMKVYPNPASQVLNVEINQAVSGNMQIEVLNLIGQKLATQAVANNKASVDVSGLPAGCYLVDCYRNGMKIATTKFIKN